jgi:uncharacterized repeat protein (TIGR01451 family)
VLSNFYASGKPLYLIGENLASDMLGLDAPQSAQWMQLTSLTPAAGKGGDGSVEISGQVPDLLVYGNFGTVSSFTAPTNFDLTTLANASPGIVGQSGSTVVLVASPAPWGGYNSQIRIVTQTFEVGGGTDPDSLSQRHTLFLNSVWWLLNYTQCRDIGSGLIPTVTPNPAVPGQAVTYQWVVENNGICDGTGAVLTSQLPPGVRFVSAQSEIGTWSYATNLGAVIFQLGLLPHGQNETVSFTVMPLQLGTYTNVAAVSINGVPTNTVQVVSQVNGLTLQWNSRTNYLLELMGSAGQSYEIQTSTDLLQWLDWTNIQGPNWTAPVPNPARTNFLWQFYRAVGQ